MLISNCSKLEIAVNSEYKGKIKIISKYMKIYSVSLENIRKISDFIFLFLVKFSPFN